MLGLTRRESEVLSWAAHGKTNLEIAEILGMSARTAQKHLEHIFQKLGVESRTSAAARAWEGIKRITAGTPH
jgi:DNA-binding CsgD family transcriptional regulator